jgi:hypothetical protein
VIVVYVELWPGGDQSRAKPIGSLGIANETNLSLLSNYRFEMDGIGNPALNIEPLKATGEIVGHNRNQSVWKLIRRAIDEVFPPIKT